MVHDRVSEDFGFYTCRPKGSGVLCNGDRFRGGPPPLPPFEIFKRVITISLYVHPYVCKVGLIISGHFSQSGPPPPGLDPL